MKGIILVSGSGTRLWPITQAVSKQLLPARHAYARQHPGHYNHHDPHEVEGFKRLLSDGSLFGVNLSYTV